MSIELVMLSSHLIGKTLMLGKIERQEEKEVTEEEMVR